MAGKHVGRTSAFPSTQKPNGARRDNDPKPTTLRRFWGSSFDWHMLGFRYAGDLVVLVLFQPACVFCWWIGRKGRQQERVFYFGQADGRTARGGGGGRHPGGAEREGLIMPPSLPQGVVCCGGKGEMHAALLLVGHGPDVQFGGPGKHETHDELASRISRAPRILQYNIVR